MNKLYLTFFFFFVILIAGAQNPAVHYGTEEDQPDLYRW